MVQNVRGSLTGFPFFVAATNPRLRQLCRWSCLVATVTSVIVIHSLS